MEMIRLTLVSLALTIGITTFNVQKDQFAGLVREVAAPDVGRMGIEILSFTIKDVYDDVQYLASLGKAQTANVKRDADVGVAQANRDAGIRYLASLGKAQTANVKRDADVGVAQANRDAGIRAQTANVKRDADVGVAQANRDAGIRAQTVNVKRDADVGDAQANRDAGIREAECDKSAMDVKYSMDTRIEDNTRLYKLQKAQWSSRR
ncbi:Flotillin 2, isoform G [Operophtera brumata]|uniref:Flotillin 2, isoform G n=1 Tax=Operophtera brumata TaxID=104452 RepID=A0A0L7KT06_OPEBR|nr:Flotillin 2, isoform G [Operophtera brumata]